MWIVALLVEGLQVITDILALDTKQGRIILSKRSIINKMFLSFLICKRENRFICHEQNNTVIENKLLIVLHLFDRLHEVAGNFAKPEMTSIR